MHTHNACFSFVLTTQLRHGINQSAAVHHWQRGLYTQLFEIVLREFGHVLESVVSERGGWGCTGVVVCMSYLYVSLGGMEAERLGCLRVRQEGNGERRWCTGA